MKTDPSPRRAAPSATADRTSVVSRRSEYRDRHFGRWTLLGLVILLGVGAFLGARPGWHLLKRVRAQHFLSESEAFIEQGQWTQAFERTRAALQLAPDAPTVLRHAAQLYARFGVDSALDYYQKLVSSPAATVADKEAYAALALALGDAGLAGNLVDDLLAAPQPTPRSLLIGSEYYALRRDYARALELARACLKAEPQNGTNILSLASLMTASRNPADRAEAFKGLWSKAESEGPLQIRALSAILSAATAPREDRERVEALLAAKPNRNLQEELLWRDARVSLDPSQRNRMADEVVDKFGHGSTEEITAATAWLNRQQFFARTLDLLLPDVAMANLQLARIRYEALIGAGDVEGAYRFIANKKFPGDPFQNEVLRCTTAAKLKDEPAIDLHLRNLLDLAQRHPRQLRTVAELAGRSGKAEIANDANKILSRNPREAERAFTALLRSSDAQGETWVARDYARKLAALRKNDEAIRLQIAYYDLLLNENIDEAFKQVETIEKAKPGDFNRRAVLAFAYLRKDEAATAAAVVEGQMVTWGRVPAGLRAVVVAVLGANQRSAAVARLVDRIPLAQLKPEERELIRPYLSGSSAPDPGDLSLEPPEKL